MPELPEVETIARGLHAEVAGATIVSVSVPRPNVLREVSVRSLQRRLRGAKILRSWRRAKLIVTDLDTGYRILVQPRFTGALIVDDGTLLPGVLDYSTVRLQLADGRSVHYCDVRRLGTFALMDPRRFEEYTSALGIEPLDRSFTPAHLSAVLAGSNQAVKKVIMDQHRLAGVGNIYANEALWRAGIDPSRAAKRIRPHEAALLHRSIVDVLTESLAARGTSFRDYRDASGEEGGFAGRLQAYGRAGEPCARCGARLIGTHEIDGRATVFCARCQS